MLDYPPPPEFGQKLRTLRQQAGFRVGQFARMLRISTTYLSDVELGRRSPFASETVTAAAALLGVDPNELLVSAAATRGAFELKVCSPQHQTVGAALMRRWSGLDHQTLACILKVLGEVDGDGHS